MSYCPANAVLRRPDHFPPGSSFELSEGGNEVKIVERVWVKMSSRLNRKGMVIEPPSALGSARALRAVLSSDAPRNCIILAVDTATSI